MTDEEYNRKWFERFHLRTTVNERGCWVWTGPVSSKGYPMHAHRSHPVQAHRTAYVLKHGLKLTRAQFVCHTCDERRCWNPAHLFVGDAKANNQDCGKKGRHHNSVKTHCKRGHAYDERNTYWKIGPGGTRMRGCKACGIIKTRLAIGWSLEDALRLGKVPPGRSREDVR